MKKYLFIYFFIITNYSVSAQDIIASFLEKHGKDVNLEVISIGKKMMETMSALIQDNPDLTEAIKGLEMIRIVSSKDKELKKEYYHSAQTLAAKSKGLEEFFSMSEDDKELKVMIRESKGSIKELLLLSEQPDGFNLISISGTINLDVLIKYSEEFNIKELNGLRSVKRNQ